MARLVLINGVPGVGKSTLARCYVDEHPLALALDIDTVRSMLGRWSDERHESGLLARRLAIEMARAHLVSGRDVVVPQFLGRLDFVQALEQLCSEVGARFIEVALVSDSPEGIERFAQRSADPQTVEHRDARPLRGRGAAGDEFASAYARLLAVVAARPNTRPLQTVEGEVEETYRQLVAEIAQPDQP